MKTTKSANNDEQFVNEVLDGLTGDFRLGERLYVFTVRYHYIGTVSVVTPGMITLDRAIIVTDAGGATDAVSQIVQGKAKPEVWEKVGAPIRVMRQAIAAVIPVAASIMAV